MISGKTMHIFIYFEQNEKYTSNLEHPSQKTTHQIRDYQNLSSDRNNFTKNKSISNDFGVEEAVNIQTRLKTLILTLLTNQILILITMQSCFEEFWNPNLNKLPHFWNPNQNKLTDFCNPHQNKLLDFWSPNQNKLPDVWNLNQNKLTDF